jgi:hypothetical protein
VRAIHVIAAALCAGSFLLPSAVSGVGAVRRTPEREVTVAKADGQSSRVRVRWVFRERDLVTCKTPSSLLRHLRARYGAADLDISAYAVDMTQERAQSFFSAERLAFEVQAVDESWLRTRFPGTPPPGLYFMHGDSVVSGYSAAEIGRYPELAELEPLLARLFAPPAVPQETLPLRTRGTP